MTRHSVTQQLMSNGSFPSSEGCSWRNYSPRHPVWVTDGKALPPPRVGCSAAPSISRASRDLQIFWVTCAPHLALHVVQPVVSQAVRAGVGNRGERPQGLPPTHLCRDLELFLQD